MNVADSQRVASALERLGYSAARQAEEADVIVLNTCVVRQSAEDKAYGRLSSLKPLKDRHPDLVINLMGCLVGVRDHTKLQARFPYVDVFSPPSDPGPLLSYLTQDESYQIESAETANRFAMMDGDLILPLEEKGQLVSAHVPVVLGCSHACTFCVIPYRRGPERSRPVGDIIAEVRSLVAQGVKEITFLGQIVDRYGKDVPDGPNLAALLRLANEIDGLERIRFLTSHPNYMTDELLDVVAGLPKVMPHIEVPVQAGDDQVLENMKRGYTSNDYRRLVEKIRAKLGDCLPGVSIATDVIVGFPGETAEQFQQTYDLLEELRLDVAHLARYSTRPGTVATRKMVDNVTEEEKMERFPGVSIATDVIVGFPGETAEQFQQTYDLLEELRLDVAHLARYSSRPGTVATRKMVDNVTEEEKMERFRCLELQQERISAEINARYLGSTVDVLFEEKVKNRWKGRTPTNKLVFVESERNLRGQVHPAQITWTGPWSMQGRI